MRYLAAAALALAAMAGWSAMMARQGVNIERARVETIGKKHDAKARAARKAVEKKKPEDVRADLRQFCRDCE